LFFLVRAAAFAGTTTNVDVTIAPAVVPTKEVVSRVAVAGATGRTGRLVVQELLERGVQVVAMVRDLEKAKEVLEFSEDDTSEQQQRQQEPRLIITKCDLTSETQIADSLQNCDAAVWCATGFSESQPVVTDEDPPFLQTIKRWMGIEPPQSTEPPTRTSIDAVGIPALAKCFLDKDVAGCDYPKVVMLSSAGVTRPSWDDAKKARFPGSADIPIVRLNPFGILEIKAESENKLRQSGAPYCIVRPAGLNDKDWPAGSRPVFSQGDVAVGRIHRKDVARILADVLSAKEATGKTFEAITLAGYPPADSIAPALKRLKTDVDGLPDDEALDATYATMQQLLPGEKQDSANIALGQTYEQMDKNEEGRFGPRGAEKVEQVRLKPTS
jgi:nucleoside-diphosphate-sugar epimerase